MTNGVTSLVEPLVRRGLFSSVEAAVAELTREYVVRQIERYRAVIEQLQTRYGMTYEQFGAYLQSRSERLLSRPDPLLNAAIMAEEEDALDWKQAREMLELFQSKGQTMTEPGRRFQPVPDVLHQPLGDEAVFLNLNNDRYYGVDDIGARMWQLLVETGDPEQVVQQVLVEYDVDEATLRADVDGFVAGLLEAGLIERCAA